MPPEQPNEPREAICPWSYAAEIVNAAWPHVQSTGIDLGRANRMQEAIACKLKDLAVRIKNGAELREGK